MTKQLSLFSGRQLKESGMNKVLSRAKEAWKQEVFKVIEHICSLGYSFTSDDIRGFVLKNPHHPGAWGAAMSAMAKKGIIRKTGKYVQTSIPGSHARMIPVWERNI